MSRVYDLPIIYEDEYLIVVDKPKNTLVVPAPKEENKDLTFRLNTELQKRGLKIRAHPCHRLDKETSGLVIFAKGKQIQKRVMEQFKRHKIKKTYIAFIQGMLKNQHGQLKSFIADAWPYKRGKKKRLAITRFQILHVAKNFSVVKLEPVTGRSNQIRIQFRDIGHPLLGERRFAFGRDWPLKFPRVALHAWRLEFFHPITKQKIDLTTRLPADMADFLPKYKIPSCQPG